MDHSRLSDQAATLMDLLGLSEDELCQVLDVDPLSLLSGQIVRRQELMILLTLLEESAEQVGPAVLRRWVRARGAGGRPIELLVARDFRGFEEALEDLRERGFTLRGGG